MYRLHMLTLGRTRHRESKQLGPDVEITIWNATYDCVACSAVVAVGLEVLAPATGAKRKLRIGTFALTAYAGRSGRTLATGS